MTSQYFFPDIYHLELELTEYQGIGQYPGSQSCSQPRSTFAKRRLSFSLQRLQLQILPGAPKKGQGDNLSRSKAPLHGCCADPRPGSGHLRRAWSRRFRWPGVTAINNNYNNKITKIIGNNNKQVAKQTNKNLPSLCPSCVTTINAHVGVVRWSCCLQLFSILSLI